MALDKKYVFDRIKTLVDSHDYDALYEFYVSLDCRCLVKEVDRVYHDGLDSLAEYLERNDFESFNNMYCHVESDELLDRMNEYHRRL